MAAAISVVVLIVGRWLFGWLTHGQAIDPKSWRWSGSSISLVIKIALDSVLITKLADLLQMFSLVRSMCSAESLVKSFFVEFCFGLSLATATSC